MCNILGMLTVGDGEQGAVRCVYVTSCYIVPLSRPVDGGVVLDIKLLKKKEKKEHIVIFYKEVMDIF